MIGNSSAMQGVLDVARRSAVSKSHLLISGEPGVGKKTLARHIHQLSGETGPCILMNASVLDEDSIGRAIAGARGGTLVLEEIEHLSMPAQVLLISEIRGNGFGISESGTAKECRVRVMATTCGELSPYLSRGAFRQDLYWMISTLRIQVPPLRERIQDLSDLVEEILEQSCRKNGQDSVAVSDAALQEIKQYPWPGNLPQLRCFLERAIILSDSCELDPDSVKAFVDAQPTELHANGSLQQANHGLSAGGGELAPSAMGLSEIADLLIQKGISDADLARVPPYAFIVNHVEKQLIAHVLAECEQVQLKAAARLGINRNTLHKKVKEYQLEDSK